MIDRETIIKLAEEVGGGIEVISVLGYGELEKFAQLVAEHEREACAKLCEAEAQDGGVHKPHETYEDGHLDGCNECTWAIRARK